MAKESILDLGKDEKAEFAGLTHKGRPGARKFKRANILQLVNSGKPDFEVAKIYIYVGDGSAHATKIC